MSDAKRPEALALVGDFYHPRKTLVSLFEKAAPDVKWSFVYDPRKVDWSGLDKYRLLVLSTENRLAPESSDEVWMDEGIARSIQRFVEGGGGLLAYHSGLASYPPEGAYWKLIGGGFQFHPKTHPEFLVSPESVAHPILEGVSAFSIVDEQYFVERDPVSTLALASSSSPRFGSSCAAWCVERGSGRVACVAPGHRPESLGNPNLQRLLGNSARWCARLPTRQ
jgi:type 1 glutamine amidotransferase